MVERVLENSLPKKVLIFAWRWFHDALPTYVWLQKRKVVDHTNCPICGFSVDSNSRVVFLFRGFKKIWKELRVTLLNNLSMDIPFKQIVLKASEILSRYDYELFVVTAWYIWGERNQIVHGRKAIPSDVVVSQIFKLFNEYSQCQDIILWQRGRHAYLQNDGLSHLWEHIN
uniref:Reverse transcriptase zinc-binding domain-containing protein n=1 Tax=Cannabis sativa TaxID=3483 RepID=A0A803PCA0_CANSA